MPTTDRRGMCRSPRAAAAIACLVMLSGCVSATGPARPLAASAPAGASPVSAPTSATSAVTVPPLTSASPGTAPSMGTAAPPSAPSDSPSGPTDPPPEPGPPPEQAPAPTPEPEPELAAPVEPYAQVLRSLGTERAVYLTFDDGPGPQTPAFLDVLAAAGVRATFCQVGNRIAEFPGVTRRMAAEGHTPCNHSWDHRLHLGSATPDVIDAEIVRAEEALAAAGATARYLRAPGGDFGTTDTLRRVAQSRGVVPLGWAVDSSDWKRPGVDAIVTNVLSAASPGAIVLLHDAGGEHRDQTLEALPRIIDGLRAAGYDLRPLPVGGI